MDFKENANQNQADIQRSWLVFFSVEKVSLVNWVCPSLENVGNKETNKRIMIWKYSIFWLSILVWILYVFTSIYFQESLNCYEKLIDLSDRFDRKKYKMHLDLCTFYSNNRISQVSHISFLKRRSLLLNVEYLIDIVQNVSM